MSNLNWYDRRWLVILLCFFFFPVGLYALWKSSKFSLPAKLIGTALIILMVVTIANEGGKSGTGEAATISTEKTKLSEVLPGTSWIALDSMDHAYEEKYEYTDDNGISHSGTRSRKTPLLLSFTESDVTLEAPRLRGIFEMATLLHRHGTSIASSYQEPKFMFNYDVSNSDKIITIEGSLLSPDIDVQYSNDTLFWPKWRSDTRVKFVRR